MAYDSSLRRLPDPYTNPLAPGFVGVKIANSVNGMVRELNSGATISVKLGEGSVWEIQLTYPEMTMTESGILFPFLNIVGGGFTNFYVMLPNARNPVSGAWTGGPTFAAGQITMGAASNQIVVSGWDSLGGDLDSGDYLKISNSNKIYRILETEYSAGTKTLTLDSDVRNSSTIPAASLEPNDIMFRVRLVGQAPQEEIGSDGTVAGITVRLKENIL